MKRLRFASFFVVMIICIAGRLPLTGSKITQKSFTFNKIKSTAVFERLSTNGKKEQYKDVNNERFFL